MVALGAGDTFMLATDMDGTPLVSVRPKENNFEFRVRSCADARVELLSHGTNTSAVSYILDIGSNENSMTTLSKVVNGNPQILAEEETPYILNCDALKDFWLMFNVNGKFEFGAGAWMDKPLLSFTDGTPQPTHAISLRSTRMGREPTFWEFYRATGKDI